MEAIRQKAEEERIIMSSGIQIYANILANLASVSEAAGVEPRACRRKIGITKDKTKNESKCQ